MRDTGIAWSERARLYPRLVASNRERNRRWCQQHRAVRSPNPWLYGAPPYGEHLPGGALPMRVRPAPDSPRIEHARHLHAAIGTLVNAGHDATIADYSIVPWMGAWGVYFRDEAVALRLAGKGYPVRVWSAESSLSFGPMHRLRAPIVRKRGRQRVRIDAVTPVCIRESGRGMYTAPTAAALRSTLEVLLARRICIQCAPEQLRLEIIERHTFPSSVQLGGKYGAIRGWLGHVIVDANAPALWLLEAAGLIGLGGKTAFGFGRVKLSRGG